MTLFDRQAKIAFAVALVTLVACGVGFKAAISHYNIHLRKLPVPLRHHLRTIPHRIGDWKSITEDATYDAAVVESLGTDKYLSRAYVLEGDRSRPTLHLHIAYYTGLIDAVPHIPDRCFVAAGFEPATPPLMLDLDIEYDAVDDDVVDVRSGDPYRVVGVRHPIHGTDDAIRLPSGDLEIRTRGYASPEGRFRWGGFMFIANNQVTARPAVIRALAFRPSERYAYYCKLQVEMEDRSGGEPDGYVELSSEFIRQMLPHLMRCLPDWAEVQSWSEADASGPTQTQTPGKEE